MARKSNPFNRLRTYLRNNRITYKNSILWLEVGNIRFKDLPESECFQIHVFPLLDIQFTIPHCEPDTALAKAYSFQGMVEKVAAAREAYIPP